MKVAIDTGPLTSGHKVRGIGAHTSEIIAAMQKVDRKEGIELILVDFRSKNFKLKTKNADVLHYTSFHPLFQTLPKEDLPQKTVVTIHDLIPLIYPKQYPPGFQGKINFMKQRRRLKHIDSIITISETSKRDICKLLRVGPEIVFPIHLAPKEIFKKLGNEELAGVKQKYNLPERFVLYVGDINYNKNIITLIGACKKAKLTLVIVGKQALDIEDKGIDLIGLEGPRDYIRFLLNIPHPEEAHYEPLYKAINNSKKIIRTGFVHEKDLVGIYNLATVYCQPSFYEGFGLPVLEAMACGTPVVAAKNSAHKEIAGDAVIYFNPKSVNDLARLLRKVVRGKKLQKEYSIKGVNYVKKFSWQKTAEETLKVYRKVTGI